jgi:hypothetical protein
MREKRATTRGGTWLLLSLLALVTVLGACDLIVDQVRKERQCGLAGACCFADDTCNPGATCNTTNGICEAVDGGVTEGGGPDKATTEASVQDQAVTPDQQPKSDAVKE